MNVSGADFIKPKLGSSYSQTHESSHHQGYPVFTPQYAKQYYEELLIGNSVVLPNNDKSGNSVEALGSDDCMSRRTHDEGSEIRGVDGTADQCLHIQAAEAKANVNRMAAVHPKRILGVGSGSPNHHNVQQQLDDHMIHANKLTHIRAAGHGHGFPSYQHQSNCSKARHHHHHHARNINNVRGIDMDRGVAAAAAVVQDSSTSSSVVSAVNGKSRNVQDNVPPRNNRCMELLFCDASCLPGSSSNKVAIVPLAEVSREVDSVDVVLPKQRNSSSSSSSQNSDDDSRRKLRSGTNPIMSWFRSKKTRAAASHDEDASADQVKTGEKDIGGVSEVVKLKMAIQEMNKRVEWLQAYYNSQMLQQQHIQLGGRRNNNNCMMRLISGAENNAKNVVVDLEEEHNIIIRPTRAQFYNAVSQARLGVKQFCRAFLQHHHQIHQARSSSSSSAAAENSNTETSGSSTTTTRVSKNVRYHIEALMNQAFYEDFENVKFQRNGTSDVLDPRKRAALFYKWYVTMSQMGGGYSWTELLMDMKESWSELYCSHSFDVFCDEKMKRVEQLLRWDGGAGWRVDLASSFFMAANSVWLLHLLAFSFQSPALIFRVATHDTFDPTYMDDLAVDTTTTSTTSAPSKAPSHPKPTTCTYGKVLGGFGSGEGGAQLDPPPNIRVMVMPGFFLYHSQFIIKCKVLLSTT